MTRILLIAGSLRAGSYTAALARAAAETAPPGIEAEIYAGLGSLPPYDADADTDEGPAAVRDLRGRITAADGVFIITPEYNGSIPGVLKNAIDWASRPHRSSALSGKAVAIAAAAPSTYGGLWAQDDLRRVLGIAGARVIDGELAIPNVGERLSATGSLVDEALRERLGERVDALVSTARPLANTA